MKKNQKSKLGDICTIRTGKLDSNASVEDGKYPFFTCAQETFSIDKFAFDTEAVLLGGNNANGIFPLKYYQGKFNAYQRTYIIESKDRNQVLNKFVYFSLRPVLEYFKSASIGAATQYLTKPVLDNLKITLPDIDTQRSIIDIVYAYDDLIETNRRRIKLLEESARLLFREWFVYFKFPNHEKIKIVDGVPEGWEKVPLSELVDFKEGPGLRNYQFRDEGIPFLNIRTFGDDEIDLNKVGHLDETEVYEKYKHFLLKEDDHVISSSGTLGRLVTIRASHLPLMLNTSLIRMRPKQPMKKWMLKAYLLYGGFIEKASSLAIGAAQLNFGPAHLNKMRILLPKNEIIDEFEKHISMIYLAKKNLLDQNQKLAQARDLLLPRLMSGEIEV